MRFEYTAFPIYIPYLKQTGAHAGTILGDSYYLHFVMVHPMLTRIDAVRFRATRLSVHLVNVVVARALNDHFVCYRQGAPVEPVLTELVIYFKLCIVMGRFKQIE
jgi:hypothetical protein